MAEKVGAGVARDAELGKYDEIAIGCQSSGARMISAALAAGSATATRSDGASDADKAMSVHLGAARPAFHRAFSCRSATPRATDSFFQSSARSPAGEGGLTEHELRE